MKNNQTIKASELRIGNLVLDSGKDVCIINGFSPFGHSVRCDESEGCHIHFDVIKVDGSISKGWESDSDRIRPIPLTEEWLLRMGFRETYDGFELETSDTFFYQLKTATMWTWSGLGEFMSYGFPSNIKYVHQLQNLYFALTNQELEIKES